MKIDRKILSYRKKINLIDDSLCQLLIKRFELTEHIGRHKLKTNQHIKDKYREAEIIKRVTKHTPAKLQPAIKKIFQLIMNESKKRQKYED